MANPEIVSELDSFDRLTVRIYRAGLTGCALFLGALGAAKFAGEFPELLGRSHFEATDFNLRWLWLGLAVSATLSVINLHIYDRKIRWLLQCFIWTGAYIHLSWAYSSTGSGNLWFLAGSGFIFATLSTFAMKEQHCFKIPIVKSIPLLLIGSLFPLVFGVLWASGALLLSAAMVYLLMAVAKWKMPLHFDIGEKSKYQV